MGLFGTIAGGILKGAGALFGSDTLTNLGDVLSGASQSVQQYRTQQAQLAGAERQAQLEQSIFDYQKSLQQTLFQREDNSVQRRVADLQSAGLSKTLAAGSGANAGQAISVTTPRDAELLKGQALQQGLANMLAIAQSKAQIEKTSAEASLAREQAKTESYDRTWYEDSGLPTGIKSGIVFTANAFAKQFGTSTKEIGEKLVSTIKSLFTKDNVSEGTVESVLTILSTGAQKIMDGSDTGSKPSNSSVKKTPVDWSQINDLLYQTRGAFMKDGFTYQQADQLAMGIMADLFEGNKSWEEYLNYISKSPIYGKPGTSYNNGGKAW